MNRTDEIRTEIVPKCPLCGEKEIQVLYEGLVDRLYGVPGEWTYRKCKSCGLIFLDPRPTAEDISKAYAIYSTHSSISLPDILPRRLRSYIRAGYLANQFGYVEGVTKLQRLAGYLIYLHPGQREYINGRIMHLPADRRGYVLDVGSGAGETLKELRRLGWRVEGVEPDPQAVDNAVRRHGLNVRAGTLEEQNFPPDHFEAVIMSHVIEHVHHPVSLLKECRRVLKPGGVLVIATPNAKSLGRRRFGAHWSVFEPPRHLTVFTRETLSMAAGMAGLSVTKLRTTPRGGDGIFADSWRIKTERTQLIRQHPSTLLEKLRGDLYQYLEAVVLLFDPDAGEELLMMATK